MKFSHRRHGGCRRLPLQRVETRLRALLILVVVITTPPRVGGQDLRAADKPATIPTLTTNLSAFLENDSPDENLSRGEPHVPAVIPASVSPVPAAPDSGAQVSSETARNDQFPDQATSAIASNDRIDEAGRARRRIGAAPTHEQDAPWYRGELSALAVVLVLIFAVAWAARRWLPSFAGGDSVALRVVARTSVTPKHTVALIQLGRRFVLVGAAGDRVNALAEITDEAEVAELSAHCAASTPARPARFERLLHREALEFQNGPAADERDARSLQAGGASAPALSELRTKLRSHRAGRTAVKSEAVVAR